MNPNTLTRLLSDRLPNFQELKAIAPHNSVHLLHFTAAEEDALIHYAGKLEEGSLTYREVKREPLAEFGSGGDRTYNRDGRGRFANKNTLALKEVRQLLRDQNLDQAKEVLNRLEDDGESSEEEIQEIRSLIAKDEDSLFLGAKEVLGGKTPKFYENKIQSSIKEEDADELSSIASKLEDASDELYEVNPILSDKLATLGNLAREEASRIEKREILEEEKAYVRQLAKETPFSVRVEEGMLAVENADKELGSLKSFRIESLQDIKLIQDKILSVSNIGVRQYLLDQLAGEIKDNEYRLTKDPGFLRMLGIRQLNPKTMDQMVDKALRTVKERLGGSLEFREVKREPLAEFASLPHSILKWNGLSIGVDYLPGAVRFPNRAYAKKLRSGYGRIHGMRGGDGRSPRCFLYPGLLRPQPEGSDLVFEVEQQDFDGNSQVKYLIGYPSQDEARAAYLREMPEDFLQGVRKVAIADLEEYRRRSAGRDYRSDFEESFDFYDPSQRRDDQGRWTTSLNRAANVVWSRKTGGIGRDIDTGGEYSDQAKRRRLEEYRQEVRAAYLRYGNQMSKAIVASELIDTSGVESLDDYRESGEELLHAMLRRSINKIDAEPLSKAIIEGSGIDLGRARERDRPPFKDEEMDVDAALRRYFEGWKPGRQDIEEASARAIQRETKENWARQEIIEALELNRLPSRYRPFLSDALNDIDPELVENLLLGGNKLLTREELEEEGYEFSEDFAEGVKLSDLEKNAEGQYKYQGEWWTLNKPKPAPEGSKKKKRVLASKRVNGTTYVKVVSFGHRDYKHNYSKNARKNYLARSAGIVNSQGEKAAGDRFSPNYWSRSDLWKPKNFVEAESSFLEEEDLEEFEAGDRFSDKALWRKAYNEAKKKFKIWPSAYGSAAVVKLYKQYYKEKHGNLDGAFSYSAYDAIALCLAEDEDIDFDEYSSDFSLKKWFEEDWVRIGADGSILPGTCGDRTDKEGKPKCLPRAKAEAMTQAERAATVRRKRREDPNPDRQGTARLVKTEADHAEPIAIDDDAGLTQKEWDAIANSVTNPAIVERVLEDVQDAIEDGEEVDFAERGSTRLAEADLRDLAGVIDEVYTDGVDRLRSVSLGKSGDIVGIFEDVRAEGSNKRVSAFAFKVEGTDTDDPRPVFKPINSGVNGKAQTIDSSEPWESDLLEAAFSFSEELYEFAAKPKGTKKKNCKGPPVSQSCGGSCISANKTCRPKEPLSPEGKQKVKKIKEKLKGSNEDSSRSKPTESNESSARRDRPNTGKHSDIDKDGFTADKIKAIARLGGMSRAEAKESYEAIQAFTLREYSEVRAFQRGRLDEVQNPRKTGERVEAINRFVENAPTYEGTVYRGMSFSSPQERDSFYSSIQNGYEVEALSSYSSNQSVARNFTGEPGVDPGILFKVVNRSGVSVQGISAVGFDEEEVIVPKGTRYRPVGQPKRSGETLLVELEEF